MEIRRRQELATLPWEPQAYGRSHLGLPLEVWLPEGVCRLLLHAGIHGEEGETTVALSNALRHLPGPSPSCAVVLAANPDGLIRGTRGNARGVDLNRNFPTKDWSPDPVFNRYTLDAPRDVAFSPGASPGSEPETKALMELVAELKPEAVVALHAPLACIDNAKEGPLGRWLAQRTGLPLVSDVGYPTPGSFGSWGDEKGIDVVTYEFEMEGKDTLVKRHVPVLLELLTGVRPWA
jgi:protein MpaA